MAVFVVKHYGGEGLKTKHIAKIDPSLYNTFYRTVDGRRTPGDGERGRLTIGLGGVRREEEEERGFQDLYFI